VRSLRGTRVGALLLAAGLTVGAPLAAADSSRADVIGRVAGCHRFAGGDKERKALDAAIERVVDEFSFVLRPIVRSRLKEANPIIGRVCVARHDDRVTVTLDERKYGASLNGKPVKVTGITGDELQMRFKLGKTALWQTFEGTDGGRINGFTPTQPGHFVTKVRVFSERLPKDLIYKLTYRRE
jgi:hypothetical protein